MLGLVVLQGCSHKTTIQEGDLYLKAQAQQITINSYRDSLLRAKSGLTQVVPPLQDKNPSLPANQLQDLSNYLANNNCMVEKDWKKCYSDTRLRLIQTTRNLDAANDKIYAGQVTVNQLISNINVIIDGIGEKSAADINGD